jgi:hypothetical protein
LQEPALFSVMEVADGLLNFEVYRLFAVSGKGINRPHFRFFQLLLDRFSCGTLARWLQALGRGRPLVP